MASEATPVRLVTGRSTRSGRDERTARIGVREAVTPGADLPEHGKA